MGVSAPGTERRARIALALAFDAVEQLARRNRGAPRCACAIAGSDPSDCVCDWAAQAGARLAVVRGAWLNAGLPSQAQPRRSEP